MIIFPVFWLVDLLTGWFEPVGPTMLTLKPGWPFWLESLFCLVCPDAWPTEPGTIGPLGPWPLANLLRIFWWVVWESGFSWEGLELFGNCCCPIVCARWSVGWEPCDPPFFAWLLGIVIRMGSPTTISRLNKKFIFHLNSINFIKLHPIIG